MASPFNVFRRNQKTMLVVVSLMAILAFVVGDSVVRFLGPSRVTANPVIVKVDSHSYHASEMYALLQARQTVANFLQRLAVRRVQKAIESGQPIPRQQIAAFAEQLAESWRRPLMDRPVPPQDQPAGAEDDSPQSEQKQNEAQAIQTVVLAAAAEKNGLVVNDGTINDYLKDLTQNVISGAELEQILREMHSEGGTIGQGYLFEALRRELLASRYDRMFQVCIGAIPPGLRWDYFQQLNRRATADAVGIPVERYIGEVRDPSEPELKAFFDRYSRTLPVANSPTPGFKRPAKAAFQYFVAKFSDFTEKALAQVTPEEMHEYYEKNKDVRYRVRKSDDDAGADAEKAGSADDKSSEAKPADADASQAPDADKPAAEKAGTEEGGDKKPAPPADAEKKSSLLPASSLHLTALVQKSDDQPATTTATDEKPATGDEKPAAEPAEGDEKSAPAAGDEKAPAEGAAADAAGKAAAEKEVAYEPFEKVEDEIRKAIADTKADTLIDEVFARLVGKMRQYNTDRGTFEAEREDNPLAEPPEPLDFAALASAEGLTAGETKLVSADELRDNSDLGKSFLYDFRRGVQQRAFPAIAFADRLFAPERSQDTNGDRFLSWKIEQTPEAVPDFDEVRREVGRELKLVEARKLATAAADKLAAEARKADKPLAELLAGREGMEVVDTGAFSWMTVGAVAFDPSANRPHLSNVHGVQSPGRDFMQAVFSATPDQIVVAMNEPKSDVYVVQIKGFEPSREDLEQRFLFEDFRAYAPLAIGDEETLYFDWLRSLDQQAGVSWQKRGAGSRPVED